MNADRARQRSASHGQIKRLLLDNACLLVFGMALAMGSSPATAKSKVKQKVGRKETEHVSKEPFGAIPNGPLQIFISIDQQKLHLYSDGIHVADALVATGVPGHPTPRGVFSVIEKDRYHHSNIYSGAPMPFMQRITWSGVAMHEGPGVGHVASHGCIRMPHDFAARLWVLTKLGVRVIIARPELRPSEFADPHLFVHKEKPSAASAILPDGVKTAQAVDTSTTTDAAGSLLREGSADVPGVSDPPADLAPVDAAVGPASSGVQTDATAVLAAPAPAPGPIEEPRDATADNASGPDNSPTAAANVTPATDAAAASEAATLDPARDAPTLRDPTTVEVNEPAPASAAQAAESATPTAPADAVVESPASRISPEPATAVSPAATEPAKPDVVKSETAPPSAPAGPAEETKAQQAAEPKADTTAPDTKASDAVAPEEIPMPLAKPAQLTKAGSGGPIAIFVSRKAGKIYVRQNFAPLFDAPVTIEHRDEPLGTHVFTAMDYLEDGATFRWNVVSLPVEQVRPTRSANYEKKSEEHAKGKRGRKGEAEATAVADPQPPPAPQEALARIEIPQDVIDQISQLMVPGSSLVVSDQGLGSETGMGTDFIVVTR